MNVLRNPNPDPRTWTPERAARLRVLDICNGDVEAAKLACTMLPPTQPTRPSGDAPRLGEPEPGDGY